MLAFLVIARHHYEFYSAKDLFSVLEVDVALKHAEVHGHYLLICLHLTPDYINN